MHHHKRNGQYEQERLDRIYSVKKHDKHLFEWEVEPSTTPSVTIKGLDSNSRYTKMMS